MLFEEKGLKILSKIVVFFVFVYEEPCLEKGAAVKIWD